MKLSHLLLTILLTALLVGGFASPAVAGDNDQWKPINPNDLAQKESQVEKGADAEAIFWEIRIDDSDSRDLSMAHYVRVKIFTERGREKYSKFDIPFFKGRKIKDVMARVIKADGSIVEIKKEDIFEREIAKGDGIKVKAKSFAVPNIEPGVIVEYRYREINDEANASGMRLNFQRDIPVQTLSYYYKPYSGKDPNFQSFNMSGIKFVKEQKGFYLATQTNVPAFSEEPRMPPEDEVRPWLLLQSVGYSVTDVSSTSYSIVTKDPSSPQKYWGAVSQQNSWLAKLIGNPDKDLKKAAAEIAGAAATPEEKLKKIYEFCQTGIKNLSFDTTLTDEQRQKLPKNKSLADVFKRKTGNAGEVDLLFGSLAAALGFETRLALAANRSKKFFDPNMTNEYFIHPAAIAVKVGDNWKFFNPGMAFLPYGMLVWYEENVWAMLVGKDEYAWVKTPLSGTDKSVAKRTGKFKLLEDGTLEGEARVEYAGHMGITRRLSNYEDTPDKREESLKEEIKFRISAAEISAVTVENITDAEKPLVYTYKVRVPNYAQKTGKRLFLQPNFFEYGTNPVFTGSKRKHQIYFNYPWGETDEIKIELPAGFTLETPEAPAVVSDAQKVGFNAVSMRVSKDGQTLTYNRKFYFGGGDNILFPVQAYEPLKTMFELFHKNDTHSLVLKQGATTAATGEAKPN